MDRLEAHGSRGLSDQGEALIELRILRDLSVARTNQHARGSGSGRFLGLGFRV